MDNAGLCVGGPLAGKWVEKRGDFLEVVETPSGFSMSPPEEAKNWVTHRYRFHTLFLRGFWIPVEKDLGFLIDALSDRYARYEYASK